MDPKRNNVGISSPCSCDNCDTLRCLIRNHEMFNDINDDKVSNTCIYFTKATLKKTNSSINETTPSESKDAQETECEICRRRFKNDHNLETVSQSGCTLTNLLNNSKSLCESCISNINKIKEQTNNVDLVIIDAKQFDTRNTTETEFTTCKPKENDTRDLKFEKNTLTEEKPMRKSKCKICVRDFQSCDNVGDMKTNISSLSTDAGNNKGKPSNFKLRQNCQQTDINENAMQILDTLKTKCKLCNNDNENSVKLKSCKLCKINDSHKEIIDSICKICKAYFPINKNVKPSFNELCSNHGQQNIKETKDPVNLKCKRCKNYNESDIGPKKCKLCRRLVDTHHESNSICKICKSYLPTSYKNSGNKDAELNTIKRKCTRCRNNIDNDYEKDKCIKNHICENCKEYYLTELESHTCRKPELWEINANKIATINNEKLQATTPKPIKCKVCNDLGAKDKTKYVTTESKNTVCTMGTEEFQTAVGKTDGLDSDLKNCRMGRISSEIIATRELCTGKSKCEVCKKYVDEWEVTMSKNAAAYKKIIPLCEFCRRNSGNKGSSDTVITNITSSEKMCKEKIKFKGCIGDIEDWETVIDTSLYDVNNEITEPETICKVTSLCQLCRKGNETIKHSNYKFCRRDVQDWQVHFGRYRCNNTSDGKTNSRKSSQCQFSRMHPEKQDKNIDNDFNSTKNNYARKVSNKDIAIPHHMDAVNNDFTLIDTAKNNYCARHIVDISRKTPAHYEERVKACVSKKSDSETKVCNRAPLRDDIHPSTLKLTAQVMNVPYEEFKESLNQQIDYVNKATMKSTLSYDIIKRIKEAYKACSCKVCECIIGKSLTVNNGCNCKPCDCADCKSFNHLSNDRQEVSKAKIIQDQPCGCTPCSCIRCTQISTETITTAEPTSKPPVRTYIAARASENRHSDNCTCPACHCAECERNFFSLSTHVTHEMSTGMVRSCRCEQCVDQRCRGAGGTDDCRCEMPSKAIFKPIEKDSHDYGIHRAAVCHQRNKRNTCRDAIAMYATVSSNYSQLRTVKEGCSCEECECISCKEEKSKLSVKTILKPQPPSQMQSIKTNTCDCNTCECDNCSNTRNTPDGHLANYKDVECSCDDCDCMNCHSVSKSMVAKLVPIPKSIGKIYYRNNIKDCNMPITACSKDMCKQSEHNVCVKTIHTNNRNNNKDFDNAEKNEHNRHCCLDTNNSTLVAKTCSVYQDFNKNKPQQYSAANNVSKALNRIKYRDSDCVVKGNTHCQLETDNCNKVKNAKVSSVPTFTGVNKTVCEENNVYENKKVNLKPLPLTLSNYKVDKAKTTLETCLNDILKLDDELNLKIGSKVNKPNIAYNTAFYDHDKNQEIDDIDVYDYAPFSNSHLNFYNKNLDGAPIYKTKENSSLKKCTLKKQNNICTIPSAISSKNNFTKTQIDYARVYNTLIEAKDFSKQLIKLLDKYERANRDFQSVSEKLKLSHEADECNKLKDSVHFHLDYHAIEKQNDTNDNVELVNEAEDVIYGTKDIKISLGSTNLASNNFDNIQDNIQDAIIFIKSDKSKTYPQKQIKLVEKEYQSERNANLTTDFNLEMKHYGVNITTHFDDIKKNLTTEAQILKIGQKTFGSSFTTTDNDGIQQLKNVTEAIDDQGMALSTSVETQAVNIEDKTNNDIKEKEETILSNSAQDAIMTQPFDKNTYNIDKLTEQLSEIIKENVIKHCEKTGFDHIKKYDTIEVSGKNICLSKENDGESQMSINRTNFHLNNLDFYIPPYGLIFIKGEKAKTHATSVQTALERYLNKKYKVEKITHLKSGSSLPRNKTTQVDKESDTRVDYLMGKNKYMKLSGSTLKSRTESDLEYLDTQSRCTELSSIRNSAMGKPKCSCDFVKVGFLGGKRVSDHTVMVKWRKPKDLSNVQGYELLVDGRPVQTLIDSSRCMAVVTCLPNSDKVLLTMKTILLVASKSGHEPSVTIVYHPRLKKNKNKNESK